MVVSAPLGLACELISTSGVRDALVKIRATLHGEMLPSEPVTEAEGKTLLMLGLLFRCIDKAEPGSAESVIEILLTEGAIEHLAAWWGRTGRNVLLGSTKGGDRDLA